jgi:hypothetical protein
MEAARWVVPALVLLTCGTVARSGAGASIPSPSAECIKIQEARVPQIEALAAADRTQVEQWYKVRRAEIVQEITRRAAAQLVARASGPYSSPAGGRRPGRNALDLELWVQYADLHLEKIYGPAYFNAGFLSYPSAVLGHALVQEYLLSAMADLLVNRQFEQKLAQIVEERLEVPGWPLLREQAAELLSLMRNVRAELTLELTQLGNRRDARLDAIMKWENDLKEQVHGILEYLRQSGSRPAQFGVVQSVGYCVESGYFCTIEGVDRVLGVGDRIGRVRVLRIDPEKVEFAHDGTTWAQPLGAPPQPFWD